MQAQSSKRTIKPGWIAAVTLLSLVLVGAWVASSTLLVVGSILVEGAEDSALISSQDVIRLSGLKFGQSMLSLDTDKIRENIQSNPYLRFVGLSKEYPSRLVIKVETQLPAARIQRENNDWLIVDYNGNVMSLASRASESGELLMVSGAVVPDTLSRVGSNMAGSDAPQQLQAVFAVLNELKLQDTIGSFSELNVSELDNLYLITISGIRVMVGTLDDELPDKVALMRAVLPELDKEGVRDGLLDVTAGNKADYRKASTGR
ncbi:hypothetical protein AGMMS49992_04840 [Clostridia bacterium]|nr:hypothetical protein AGMMS49992_04840 [Clostridia bacterium]